MNGIRERLSERWEAALVKLDERERSRARRLPAWRTRRHRRAVAVVCLTGVLTTIAGALIMSRANTTAFLIVWFTGYGVWLAAYLLLRTLAGTMASAFSALLDERERQWRHRANQIGYQFLSSLMVLAVLYTFLISRQEDAALRAGMFTAALLGLGSSLPALLLGWWLPDDDPEDVAEPDFAEEGTHD